MSVAPIREVTHFDLEVVPNRSNVLSRAYFGWRMGSKGRDGFAMDLSIGPDAGMLAVRG